MTNWESLEQVLRERGLGAAELDTLRRGLGSLVVHSNTGVVANSISGPIAIGAGATASMSSGTTRSEDRGAGNNSPAPAETKATDVSALTGPSATDAFWKRAGDIATTASTATVAVSKILEIAAKLF